MYRDLTQGNDGVLHGPLNTLKHMWSGQVIYMTTYRLRNLNDENEKCQHSLCLRNQLIAHKMIPPGNHF